MTEPKLHEGAANIPAMTSPQERLLLYLLAKDCAKRGAVVEVGCWLGASTAYIAAGVRDARAPHKAQVYDAFVWRPDHVAKASVGLAPGESFEPYTRAGLGPLMGHVELHKSDITALHYRGEPIALLVLDMPKRFPDIARTLAAFGPHLHSHAVMVWQDFGFFPAYAIPASLYRLAAAGRVKFIDAAWPGTMVALEASPWKATDAAGMRFALDAWTVKQVDEAWAYWDGLLPAPMLPLFRCGALLMRYDLGDDAGAAARFRAMLDSDQAEAILPKWRKLRQRPAMTKRYPLLFAELGKRE